MNNNRRLTVRSCRVIGADDTSETHHTVQCPRREAATPFAECCGCAFMHSIELDTDGKHGVDCGVAADQLPADRLDLAEQARRVRVGDLVGTDTTCVRSDVHVELVADLLMSHRLRALPVVDNAGRLVGIISKTDLLRSSRRRSPKTAGDIMTPVVHGLPEDAPVAYAVSLMGVEGVQEISVVDKVGRVLGMLTSTDALRWVARSLGCVTPGNQGG